MIVQLSLSNIPPSTKFKTKKHACRITSHSNDKTTIEVIGMNVILLEDSNETVEVDIDIESIVLKIVENSCTLKEIVYQLVLLFQTDESAMKRTVSKILTQLQTNNLVEYNGEKWRLK